MKITQQYVKERLHYDPLTGIFTWKNHPSYSPTRNRHWAGKQAGCREKDRGYVRIEFKDEKGKRYAFLAHRLAWLYCHGSFPPRDIDHIDCNPSNNALSNLRLATKSQNLTNTRVRRDNKFGLKGVQKQKGSKGYSAKITVDGAVYCLGTWPTPEMAHRVYAAVAREFFGEFARAA